MKNTKKKPKKIPKLQGYDKALKEEFVGEDADVLETTNKRVKIL